MSSRRLSGYHTTTTTTASTIKNGTTTAAAAGAGAATTTINSSSVQTQFQTLASHKTSLQQQIRQADADRLVETQTIARIRQAEHNLLERIRIASSNNGVEEKKRETLKNEVKRLEETLKDDQKELKELSLEVEQLQKKEIQSKYQFVKEMEAINDEMADALRRCEECNLENILTMENCRVIQQFLEEKVNVDKKHDEMVNGEHEGGDAACWEEEQLIQIRILVKHLEDCDEKCKEAKSTQSLLMQTAFDLRKRVQKQNYDALGEEELNSLEQLWEQQQEQQEEHLVLHDSDLFLLSENWTTSDAAADEDGDIRMHQQQEEHSSDAGADDRHTYTSGNSSTAKLPVSMHLFYGQTC